MQSDPIGLDGGENSFVYVGGNPLIRVDESGLDWMWYISDCKTWDFAYNVIRPTLNYMGSPYNSIGAEQLLLGTALQESGHFQHRRQIGGGPGRGYYQVEIGKDNKGQDRTFNDLYNNYLRYRPQLKNLINSLGNGSKSEEELEKNDYYATAVARIIYFRKPGKIYDNDILGQAYYWKQYYNTASGDGTVDEYLDKWKQYVYDDIFGLN